jgi:hypothetical protein
MKETLEEQAVDHCTRTQSQVQGSGHVILF